jgi:hypothetical protein
MKNHLFTAVITSIFIALFTSSVLAQSILLVGQPQDKLHLEFKYMRPAGERFDNLSTFSGVYDLRLNVPVNAKLNLVGSVPICASSYTNGYNKKDIGNLYVGIQSRPKSTGANRSTISVGAFLPTAPNDYSSAMRVGFATNYYDAHKYITETLTLYGNVAFYRIAFENAHLGFEIGPNVWVPIDDEGREVEILTHYGLSGGLNQGDLTILAELVGTAIISEEIDEFGDRFIHELSLGAFYAGLPVKPGLFYKMYLEEGWREYYGSVFGLKLETAL